MRAADFSWEAPPSPFKPSISRPAIIALQLRDKRHSVPPKESCACFLIHVRGCLPQSLHSPQFSEPDPIYPYLPFLFCSSFGNDRANFVKVAGRSASSIFFRKIVLRTQTNTRIAYLFSTN